MDDQSNKITHLLGRMIFAITEQLSIKNTDKQ